MKIIFFGSGKIAVHSLKFLLDKGYEMLGVVTSPDSRKGRDMAYSFTPIKEFALANNLNIFQPLNPSAKESIEQIKKLNADIFIVFSYGKILSKELLKIPKLFALNIHASLLPKYRGAAPINWALINEENKTGITIIKMNERLDEGDIILKKEIEIDYFDNAVTLEERLAELAVGVLSETLLKIKNKDLTFLKQDDSQVSYAPRLKKEDGRIDWNKSSYEIRNKIRGCYSWPGAFTFYNNKLIKIWEAEVGKLEPQEDRSSSVGMIISLEKRGIAVTTKDKYLLIKELQFSSRKRMQAWQFIQGHTLKKGEIFT